MLTSSLRSDQYDDEYGRRQRQQNEIVDSGEGQR
jgi:hypothetical protein